VTPHRAPSDARIPAKPRLIELSHTIEHGMTSSFPVRAYAVIP
jgi:hypothetical protein